MRLNELYKRLMGRNSRQIRRRLSRQRTFFRPRLERLEDRTLLSAPVTDTAGLITAINAANTSGGSTTITLQAGTTFDFTSANNSTNGANALPVITANITIIGNGDTIERGTGSNAFRFFDVPNGASLTLQNLTLSGGLAQGAGAAAEGGAIFSTGRVVLSGVAVKSNVAQGGAGNSASGGGVFVTKGSLSVSNAYLILNNDSFINNQAVGGTGGNGGNGPNAFGFAGGNFGNSANGGAGGAGGIGGQGRGGGLFVGGSGTIVTGSSNSFVNNKAQGGSGGNGGAGGAGYSPTEPIPFAATGGAGGAGGAGGIGGAGIGGGLYVAASGVTLTKESMLNNQVVGGQGGQGGQGGAGGWGGAGQVAADAGAAGAGGNGGTGGAGIGGGLYVAPGGGVTLTSAALGAPPTVTVTGGGGNPRHGGGGVTTTTTYYGNQAQGGVGGIGGVGGTAGGANVPSDRGTGGTGGTGGIGGAGTGGGLAVAANGSVTLKNTSLSGNQVQGGTGGAGNKGGGGTAVSNLGGVPVPGRPGSSGQGGAGGNGAGGGLATTGSATLINDTLASNQAQGGQGGQGGQGRAGTFGGHGQNGGAGGTGGAGIGGGLYMVAGSATLINDTVGDNQVQGGAAGNGGAGGMGGLGGGAGGNGGTGGTGGNGSGGGLYLAGGSAALINDTVGSNQAQGGAAGTGGALGFGGTANAHWGSYGSGGTGGVGAGGGLYVLSGATSTLANTLIAENTTTAGTAGTVFEHAGSASAPDVSGTVASSDHDLIGNDSGASGFSTARGDILNPAFDGLDPQLLSYGEPLVGAPGSQEPMLYMSLFAGSPAIDAGDGSSTILSQLKSAEGVSSAAALTDERGFSRIVGNAIDIGAVEYQYDISVSISAPSAVLLNQNITYNISVTNNGPDPSPIGAQFTVPIPGGTVFQSAREGATTLTPSGGAVSASGSLTLTVKDETLGTVSETVSVPTTTWDTNPTNNSATVSTTSAGESTSTSISAPTVNYGSNASVTVTVSAPQGTPTGNVALTVGSTTYTQGLDSTGASTFTIPGLAAGTYTLSASYAGQGNFAVSSATGSLTVAPAAPTLSVSLVTPGGFIYQGESYYAIGTAVGLDGTTPVSGSFTYTYSNATSGQRYGSTPPTSRGVYFVNATFTSTDSNYSGGSIATSYQIYQAYSSTVPTPVVPSNAVYNGQQWPATDSDVIGSIPGPYEPFDLGAPTLTYYQGTYTLATLPSSGGSSDAPINAGNYTVVAFYAGTTGPYTPPFEPGSSLNTYSIGQATPTLSVSDGGTYNGNPFAAVGTALGVNNQPVSGLFTYTYYVGTGISGQSLGSTPPTDAGTYTVVAAFTSSNSNYASGTAQVTFTINPMPVVLSGTGVYDGTTTTAASNLSISNKVYNDDVTLSGSATLASSNVGSEQITSFAGLSLVGSSASNYTLKGATGSVNVTPASLVISAVSVSKTYDGTTNAYATPTFSGLQGSDSVTGLSESYGSANAGPETLSVNPGYVINDGNNGNNYFVTLQTASGTINQAQALISIQGVSVTYDGNAHAATDTATGVESPNPANLSSLLTLYYSSDGGQTYSSSAPVNAGHYEIYYTFAGNTNYQAVTSYTDSGYAVDIAKANANITVTPYSVTYDSNSHTATGSVTGVGGVALSGLNLSGTTHTNAGSYNGDAWSFAGGTNYNDASGTVNDSITKADAVVLVTGYTGTYDGHAHGATGSVTGVDVGGTAAGTSLNLGASFTNVPGGTAHWTFSGGINYNDQSGNVAIVINKAHAIVSVTGYTGTYDGHAHGATGSVTGVDAGATAAGTSLNLGASFINVPGGTAHWTLSGGVNYFDASGDVAILITPKALGSTASASTQSALNIAKDGTLSFKIRIDKAGIVDGQSVAQLFNGMLFSLSVGGRTYSVQAVATVTDGVINVSFKMTDELKAILAACTNATNASNAPTVGIGLHAATKDGNYSLDATASTKLFNSTK